MKVVLIWEGGEEGGGQGGRGVQRMLVGLGWIMFLLFLIELGLCLGFGFLFYFNLIFDLFVFHLIFFS